METFFANCYDYFVEKSLVNDLYFTNLCGATAYTTIIVPLLGVILFYYAINTTRFGERKHWFIMMLASGLIVFGAIYLTCTGMQEQRILININVPQSQANLRFSQGGGVFFTFALEMLAIASLFFLIFSLCLKWKSRVYKTPF